MVELLPSILSSDFANLEREVQAAERGGGTVIHVDVMDGHFVPNITLGPPVVKSLRKATRLPLDCHLMIENPNDFIPAFAEAGANWVSVHYEACPHLHRTLEMIAGHGMKPGVVVNPATRIDVVEEILEFFQERIAWVEKNGVSRDRLIIDPGIGFGKTRQHNLTILKHLDRFSGLGLPVLLGHSRKRFLGDITGLDAGHRDLPTAVVSALTASRGVAIIRVHDVAATRQALLIAEAIRNA